MDKEELMESVLFKHVKILTTDGETYIGKVKVYETPYDNDSDEGSVCLMTDDGEGICLVASEIEDIEIV